MADKNWTDPKVILDPSKGADNIAMPLISESLGEEENENEVINPNADHDSLMIDGISYPLLCINNRNISKIDILYMDLQFKDFLPEIVVKIRDRQQTETKLNTTGMSGSIRVCITSPVDKTYKKILLHFRILKVDIDEYDNDIITYHGIYDADKLRQVNTEFIEGEQPAATTWELLNDIAQKTGLGFAATDQTKEVEDRVLRNIYTEKYGDYIVKQLKFSGTDEENILDAWIDPYNYIVLVNIPWVLSQDVSFDDLEIISNCGLPNSQQGIDKVVPKPVTRIFTNFSNIPISSNMVIRSYKLETDNDAIYKGTLERIYTISWDGTQTKMDTVEIQTKQNSVDGEYIEEYNTGASRPIPRFNFNEGGYDLHTQEVIRNHFFRKKRQSILKVVLEQPNLGIQRGTLIGIQLYEQDVANKQIMLSQASNIGGAASITPDEINVESDTELNLVESECDDVLNVKLTDLYYVDGIEFEYNENDSIVQILSLIKKGHTSGYNNIHTLPKVK